MATTPQTSAERRKGSRRVHGDTVHLGQTVRMCLAVCAEPSANTRHTPAPTWRRGHLSLASRSPRGRVGVGVERDGQQPVPQGPAEATAGRGASGEASGSTGSSLGDSVRWALRQAGGRGRRHGARDGERRRRRPVRTRPLEE